MALVKIIDTQKTELENIGQNHIIGNYLCQNLMAN